MLAPRAGARWPPYMACKSPASIACATGCRICHTRVPPLARMRCRRSRWIFASPPKTPVTRPWSSW
eukprot:404183-Alexandrium_andersonii.AAC.1